MPLKDYSARRFIGRDNEVNAVVAAATAALHDDAGSLYLAGGKGVGKTEILRNAYGRLFDDQNDVIPFFYTVKTAFSSIDNFSIDFFSSFIVQTLAFMRRDVSLSTASIYTMDDLREMSERSNLDWCVELIERFSRINDGRDMMKIFSFAVSAPVRCRESAGLPVTVIIDDFHKIRKMCELNTGGGPGLRMLFENLLESRTISHIITGYQPELQKMFFEESSIGEDLEIMYIRGLRPEDSVLLFETLCKSGGVEFDRDAVPLLDRFRGNPYYIRSFVQASRHAGVAISPDTFDDIYFNEVTRGKLFTYWVSALKHHIPHFEMRRPALRFLDAIREAGPEPDLSSMVDTLTLDRERIDQLIDLLIRSGALDAGFSTLGIADDPVFHDVLKGLLMRELGSHDRESLKKELMGSRPVVQKTAEEQEPMFIIGIPARKEAGLVAVRSAEHVASHYGLSGDLTGQLQMALVETFAILPGNNGSEAASYKVGFGFEGGVLTVEVSLSGRDPLPDEIRRELREAVGHYVDEFSIDDNIGLPKIVLRKSSGRTAPGS